MPVGLEVVSDTGSYQIVNSYYNHLCTHVENVYFPANSHSTRVLTLQGSDIALFGFHSPNVFSFPIFMYENGAWTINLSVYNPHNTQQLVQVYTFDRARNITSSGFGLEVYNEQGEMLFSASHPPLRIIDNPVASKKMGFMVSSLKWEASDRDSILWGKGLRLNGANLEEHSVNAGYISVNGDWSANSAYFNYTDLTGM